VVALALSFIALAGCRPEDEVRTYRIAKPADASGAPPATATAPQPAAKPPSGEPTDRMIGAIVPGPSQAWFFKAVGPKAAIDGAADAITKFLDSVRFDGDQPKWETPKGWTEDKAGGMRLATLKIPVGDDAAPIEMSVIGLPLVGDDWDAQVLDNANRWRKQLQQPPLAADAAKAELKPLADVAEGAVLFDTLGWFDGGTMAPFAGGMGAGGAAPFANAAPPAAAPPAPPAQTPPTQSPPTEPPAPREGALKYDLPEGWTEAPADPMRKVSLRTPGGAALSGFSFPLVGVMGDPLQNVNRWRGEIGLEPITADDLKTQSEEIKLLGGDGSYFELVGASESTHAVMLVRDNQVWFFKLRGSGDEVAKQRDAFKKWLGSLSL
jgi:hypothetical protein